MDVRPTFESQNPGQASSNKNNFLVNKFPQNSISINKSSSIVNVQISKKQQIALDYVKNNQKHTKKVYDGGRGIIGSSGTYGLINGGVHSIGDELFDNGEEVLEGLGQQT